MYIKTNRTRYAHRLTNTHITHIRSQLFWLQNRYAASTLTQQNFMPKQTPPVQLKRTGCISCLS